MKNRTEVIQALCHNGEDKLKLSHILDRLETAQTGNYLTNSRFLDLHMRDIAQRATTALHAQNCSLFWGGWQEAERVIAVFYPDYLSQEDALAQSPLAVLRATGSAQDKLGHRDYLGALMGLQIDRSMIGDIIVHEGGADLIVLEDIADFLLHNFAGAGRKKFTLNRIPMEELRTPVMQERSGSGTVASMRLDSVGALLFGVSRATMQGNISKGLVYVNHNLCVKPDFELKVGDLLNLRGAGRAKITVLGGKSKKDRQFIEFVRNM